MIKRKIPNKKVTFLYQLEHYLITADLGNYFVEIQEDSVLRGDSGKGEEELYQAEVQPAKLMESTSPSTKNRWFAKAKA